MKCFGKGHFPTMHIWSGLKNKQPFIQSYFIKNWTFINIQGEKGVEIC